MSSALTIWCNAKLPREALSLLAEAVAGHRLIGPELGTLGEAGTLSQADVAFGQPEVDQLLRTARLRWVHVTSAGYTSYDRADVREALQGRGAALTKSSMVFDEPCAQHVMALLFAHARVLPGAYADARGERTWPTQPLRRRSSLLGGQTVALVGFGTIARRLVQLLAPLQMTVFGLRRAVIGDEPVPTFALDSEQATRALREADHVVNLLPANDSTHRLFDQRRLETMKPGAVFYNIGRGTTVDQEALMAALTTGRLAAAYLDVTDPEPLPPAHPLWEAPNCFITPHTAGGHATESLRLVRHFKGNLSRFVEGAPLLDRVF